MDHVIADMVIGLGAAVRAVDRPFNPEGGAYGHGAVQGHSHGHGHEHDHRNDDGDHQHEPRALPPPLDGEGIEVG